MIDETLRKKMELALDCGDYAKALELSRELDKQIVKYTKHSIGVESKNAAASKIELTSYIGC